MSTFSDCPMTSATWILVAEDEDSVRRVLVRVLVRAGFSVLEAQDGYAALEQLQKHPHLDLLVADVVMPRMSGTALAQRVRDDFPHMPILMMSGHTQSEKDRSELPGVPFLKKPFDIKQIVEIATKLTITRDLD